jgi:2-polyprenyl-3-methyl-5-hydroxy-6-metoxy-1,4-benzoquinol methylase
MIEVTRAATVARPPRSIAWVLLTASSAAVLLTGLVATALVLASRLSLSAPMPAAFWPGLLAACILTAIGLGVRSLRWVFLLRRAGTRIPIGDAYIGYLAGFSLLLAPLLLGELAVRAYILNVRGGVPPATTALVNVWERVLDLMALALIVGVLSAAAGDVVLATACLSAVAASAVGPWRSTLLKAVTRFINRVGSSFNVAAIAPVPRLTSAKAWTASIVASLVAWTLPALGFWILVVAWGASLAPWRAVLSFSAATIAAAVTLSPGGVVVTGERLLQDLGGAAVAPAVAVLLVLGIRLATAGLATALGLVFLFVHLRTRNVDSSRHFDQLADSYDVQIPAARREALLVRKTTMMRDSLSRLTPMTSGSGESSRLRGLDIGCGQGWYVGRMRELGFDVAGIDASAGQVALAGQNLGDAALVRIGSVLDIPAADGSLDFVYTINVLHHLSSIDEQRRAFRELARVLRPGGLLFVHEINTTNVLFRFYMGYVFPSVNCIDEGVERWLLPRDLAAYAEVPVVEIHYFTFLPEFLPAAIVRWLSPIERALERSSWLAYSAHYMAVLRKPA